GSSVDPVALAPNLSLSFQGCNISGQGFLFDNNSAGASSIEEMHDILESAPWAAPKIRPYIGGDEVNTSPSFEPQRFVISLGRLPLDECRAQWPALVKILERKVKPDRESRPKNAQSEYLAARWWQWHTDRPTMQKACAGLERFLVGSQVTAHMAFAFLSADTVPAHTLNVFALCKYAAFSAIQTRAHEIWARFFGSTLEDRLRYTPTDCFETSPFPEDWQSNQSLESAGQAYYEFRAALMIRNNEGLTKTYNRFHDPDEHDPDIVKLRQLHAEMDHAVLTAYGWQDLAERAHCEFQLEYEDPEDDDEDADSTRKKKKKKPWRYK